MQTSTHHTSFLSTRRGKLTLALVCLAGFLDFVDTTIVNVALPSIRHGLGFSVAEPAVGHQRIPADLWRTAAPRRPRRRSARPPPAARGRDYAVRAVLPDRRTRRQRCRDDRAPGSPKGSARR